MDRLIRTTNARRGNAIVAAFAVLTIVAVLVAVSTESAVATHVETFHRSYQEEAIAAVDAVLAKHEGELQNLAEQDLLRTWTGGADPDHTTYPDDDAKNYGVDWIGRTAVLWRVEPARSLFPNDDAFNTTTTVNWMLQNPSPSFSYQPNNPLTGPQEIINDFNYMFRIAGEARVQQDPNSDPLAKAQGSRYVMFSGEPLFRYAIFYAHEGPKGDLELSHGPAVSIKGGVYSNGAIYLGSGTMSTSWTALSPPNGPTLIGPDTVNRPVRCVGLDGIFCMSKPLMYRAFNGYPTDGTDPGFTPNFHTGPGYPTTPGSSPIEATAATPALATTSFTYINPYRVDDAAKLATSSDPSTNPREINGHLITSANDGRDLDRPSTDKWNPKSLTDFVRKALSRETNAHKKILPGFMSQRPLEAQALQYPSGANDDPSDDLDEHRKAMPMFLAADGSTTYLETAKAFTAPLSFAEIPGQYLRYALGSPDTYMVRNGARSASDGTPFTGWSVLRLDGTPAPSAPAKCGLIIRERPVPDFRYYTAMPNDLSPAEYWNPPYNPFAYGKHKRPYLWPFTEMFISDRATQISNVASSWVTLDNSGNNRSDLVNSQEYGYGGYLKFSSAQWCHAWPDADSPDDGNGFYRSNWRLIHLKKVQPSTVASWDRRRANMRDTNSYFHKSEFLSIQAKIADLNGGRTDAGLGAEGRKTGLMIAMADTGNAATSTDQHLDAQGFNARFPYVAILYSPERGFFTERRLDRSTLFSTLAPAGAYFTNTDDGFAMPPAWTGPMATVYHPPNQITTDYTNWTDDQRWDEGAATYVTIDTGEGLCSFLTGGYTRKFQRTAYAKRKDVVIRLKLSDPAPGSFLPIDDGITIFGTPWSSTNDPAMPAYGNSIGYVAPDEVNIIIDPQDAAVVGGTTGPTVDASRASPGMTIYKRYRDVWGGVSDAGQWDTAVALKGGDEAALIASLQSKGYTVDTSDPPDLWPAAPSVTSPPAAYSDSDIATWTGFAIGTTAATGNTFRVSRLPRRDVNSYISQRGAWYFGANHGTGLYNPPADTMNSLNTVPTASSTTQMFLPYDVRILPANYPQGSGCPPNQWAGHWDGVAGDRVDYTPPTYNQTPESIVGSNTTPWADAQFPDWSNGASYALNACVLHNGRVFKCKAAHAASPTTEPGASGAPLWTSVWDPGVALWARIEELNNLVTSHVLVFKYYVGTTQGYVPTSSDFTEISDMHGTAARAQVSDWGGDWLIGPVIQSGDPAKTMSAVFSNITLTVMDPTLHVIDQHEWENRLPGDPNEYTRYLCSQYQAFWGDREITEDFFSWNQDSGFGMRTVTEDWFWNNREFWSQSRWWNEGDGAPGSWIEKETGTPAARPLENGDDSNDSGSSVHSNREWDAAYWRQLFSKTTVLNLNMQAIQDYIRTQNLTDATTDKIGAPSPAMSPVPGNAPLLSSFNGLIYAARTNRYPWNPRTELTAAQLTAVNAATTTAGGTLGLVPLNPFNPLLPNAAVAAGGDAPNFTALSDPNLVFTTSGSGPLAWDGNPQIEDNVGAFAFKSVDFWQGVMISNGDTIDWNGHSRYSDSKLTVVTPNALYLKGDLNTTPSAPDPKFPPMAVMGDSVTLLSNNWDFLAYQNRVGLKVCDSGMTNGGSLAMAMWGWHDWLDNWAEYKAADTSYNTCIVTNNQPTTKDRVRLGEGAAFVNNLLFLENWQGHNMNYLGSLVVLDTCRFTHSFLLEEWKKDGRSPFGMIGFTSAIAYGGTGTQDYGSPGQTMVPRVYWAPSRNLSFNNDLLTREGEPPFAPFAITPTGMGSWSRITQ